MNSKKFFPRSVKVKKHPYVKSPRAARISAFERGLVTWIDESYNPDSYLDGRVSDSGNNGVNFDD